MAGMASGPTSFAKPGIFDYGVDYYRGQQEASKYGADPSAGLNKYSEYANDTRNPGLAAQMDAAGFYRAQAMGQTPSLAEMQMRQGLEQGQRQTMQAATMGRGGNLAGMQQGAISAGAGMAAQTNQAAAMLRAQEQQAAMAGLAGLGGQMYGQGMGYDQLAAQSSQANAAQMLDWYSARRGMDLQESQNNWNRKMGLMNFGWGVAKDTAGMIQGGMAGGLTSDERLKQNMAPTGGSVSEAAAMATPIRYEYDPRLGNPGPKFGFGAQALERTSLGPALVRDTPQGKMVDTQQASMAALAGVGELRQQLDAITGGQTTPSPFTGDARAARESRLAAAGLPGTINPFDPEPEEEEPPPLKVASTSPRTGVPMSSPLRFGSGLAMATAAADAARASRDRQYQAGAYGDAVTAAMRERGKQMAAKAPKGPK
jgi:hypothetical protein